MFVRFHLNLDLVTRKMSAVVADHTKKRKKKNVLALYVLKKKSSCMINGPWTHTSDDSYIYQVSLVLATATISFYRY